MSPSESSKAVPPNTARFPPSFEQVLELPKVRTDQYGNPVVTRNGSEIDPPTHRPYEIWLREPRMEFVFVTAGEFMMGGPDQENKQRKCETPHRVRITKPFYIGKYEVTRDQWERTMGGRPWAGQKHVPEGDGSHPVVFVSWEDRQRFLARLSGQWREVGFRLPTEAEWEYACRAGTRSACYWGDGVDPRYCNFADRNATAAPRRHEDLDDGYGLTSPVGRYRPNPFGLYDMLGNVWEWCSDRYDSDYYSKSPTDDPQGPASGSKRTMRGASWADPMQNIYCARRSDPGPEKRTAQEGLRIVVMPKGVP